MHQEADEEEYHEPPRKVIESLSLHSSLQNRSSDVVQVENVTEAQQLSEDLMNYKL